jgi:hypothetical protein
MSISGSNKPFSATFDLDPARCECLFVLVADGRRWFIPTRRSRMPVGLTLGGPVLGLRDRTRTAPRGGARNGALRIKDQSGGVCKRTKHGVCKTLGTAFAGSNPASPIVVGWRSPSQAGLARPKRRERADNGLCKAPHHDPALCVRSSPPPSRRSAASDRD